MEEVRRDSTVEKAVVVWEVMRVAVMGLLSFWGDIVMGRAVVAEDVCWAASWLRDRSAMHLVWRFAEFSLLRC